MRHTSVLFRPADGVCRYLDDATRSGDSAARERLERVAEVLVSDRCRCFADCITWARRLFEVRLACWRLSHTLSVCSTARVHAITDYFLYDSNNGWHRVLRQCLNKGTCTSLLFMRA